MQIWAGFTDVSLFFHNKWKILKKPVDIYFTSPEIILFTAKLFVKSNFKIVKTTINSYQQWVPMNFALKEYLRSYKNVYKRFLKDNCECIHIHIKMS